MGGEFVQIGLAEDDGPGGAQAGHGDRVGLCRSRVGKQGLATVVGKPRTSILSLITRGCRGAAPGRNPEPLPRRSAPLPQAPKRRRAAWR